MGPFPLRVGEERWGLETCEGGVKSNPRGDSFLFALLLLGLEGRPVFFKALWLQAWSHLFPWLAHVCTTLAPHGLRIPRNDFMLYVQICKCQHFK